MKSLHTLVLSTVILFSSIASIAQSGLPQVPEDAFFVSRISGKSLQSKMSIADMDALPVFQSLFKEGMNKSSLKSFNDMGVNFNADAYAFAQKNDSIMFFCWMLPIADLAKFKTSFFPEIGIPEDATPPYADGDVSLYWDDKAVVFVVGQIDNNYTELHMDRLREMYELSDEPSGMNDYYGYEEEEVIEPNWPEEEEVESLDWEYEVEAEDATRDAAEDAMDAVKDAKDAVGEAVESVEEVEITDEYEVVEDAYIEYEDEYSSGYDSDEIVEEYDPYDYGYNYGYDYGLTYSEGLQLTQAWQAEWLAKLMSNAGQNAILRSPSHQKVAASKSDASAYFDYGAYMELMMGEMIGGDMMYMDNMYAGMFTGMQTMTEGSTVFSELNFGDEEIAWDVVYTTSGELAEVTNKMFDAKLDKKYLKYMNSDDMIGFYTMAINSEAVIDYYATIMSYYMTGISKNSDAGEISAELLSLVLDEEGIAELFPGSAVITMSDFSTRMIEYTTYDYDENWNRIPVVREKEEAIPTFLGMMASERTELLTKMMRLAATMEDDVVATDYGFQINGGPFPIYLMTKGGILFISNDLAQVNDISKGNFKSGLSSAHKKAITKNNSVLYFDAEELIEDMEIEFPSGEVAEMLQFAKGKAKTMTITSALKDSKSSYVKAVIEVPEGESNGWSYMMNVFNSFYESYGK